MAKIVLSATQDPAYSEEVVVTSTSPTCFRAVGFHHAFESEEEASIEFKDAEGGWHSMVVDGSELVLDYDNSFACVYAPGVYRAAKSKTHNAVFIDVATDTSP